MKQLIFFILLVFTMPSMAQKLNVVTYNIRLNTSADGINAWPERKDMVTGLLKFHETDIFGVQEALFVQMTDIAERMPNFTWIGTGRDDGEKEGEFSAIFYNKEKFKLQESGQFWLSENPSGPGLGWDAACNRVCTWGRFKLAENGAEFFMFNTHFDHIGKVARAKSAQLILQKIKELTAGKSLPVILTGDFNLTPDSEPIEIIKKELSDSREVTEMPPYGPVGTFNSFKHDHPLDGRIDYVFVNKKVEVKKYGVLTDALHNRYPSDHLPIFVQAALR